MEISELLKKARSAVDEAELPQDLREIAFAKAVDLLSSPPEGRETPHSSPTVPTEGPSEGKFGSRRDRLAAKMTLNPTVIDNIYDLSSDDVTIVVPRSRFPAQRGPATKLFARLLSAGRQGAGYDDGWTPTDLIREKCSDFGVLDKNNFAAYVSDDEFFATRGKGQKREVKVTQHGFEQVATMIQELAR